MVHSEDELQTFEFLNDLNLECNCDCQYLDLVSLKCKENVKGRYEKNFWHEAGADISVIDIVETGYEISFASAPSTKFFENNRSPIENSEFASDIIDRLLNTGRIVKRDALLYVVKPLSVSKAFFRI